jgi:CRP-like cAMP-binding protein
MDTDFARSHFLLQTICEDSLSKAIGDGSLFEWHYNKDQVMHAAGEPCLTLDIVERGKLIAYSLSVGGNATTMFEFLPGAVIGANLLLSTENKYPFNIYCEADSRVIHITAQCVKEFLHSYDFTLEFIVVLSKNSSGLNRKITFLTQNSLRENLVAYLLKLAEQMQSKSLTLPMSKKQLADYLGVQRPSLFRELKKMRDEKLIEYHNRRINLFF